MLSTIKSSFHTFSIRFELLYRDMYLVGLSEGVDKQLLHFLQVQANALLYEYRL